MKKESIRRTQRYEMQKFVLKNALHNKMFVRKQ